MSLAKYVLEIDGCMVEVDQTHQVITVHDQQGAPIFQDAIQVTASKSLGAVQDIVERIPISNA